MTHARVNEQAIQGIARYRASDWHRDHPGNCRFEESCSHYAERALRRRSFPVALLLVVWRILRCNPLAATRRDRQRAVGVLALAGFTTLLVSWPASALAAPPSAAGGSQTSGGCFALVGGQPIGNLDKDHPLQVHKGQKVVVEGQAPTGVANAAKLDGRMFITIHFIDGLAKVDGNDQITHGAHFSTSANVDSYLKYGSGLYKLEATAVAAGGWDCSATFYAQMNGSKLAAEIAVAVGCVGVVGATLASRGDAPEPPTEPTRDNSAMSSEQLDEQRTQDKILNLGYTSALGCLIAAMVLMFKGINMVAPPPMPAKNRVYVKGHTILGFLSGLVAGIGIAIAGQQYAQWTLNPGTAIVLPLVTAVLCAVRARIGRAWKVTSSGRPAAAPES